VAQGIGLYGKLPGYGDFIERNLPQTFVRPWDQWLQQVIAGSRQMLGEHWMDSYLTAPVWRFALSPGCVDDLAWLGIVLPSVDRVGRYFPLTIAVPATASTHVSLSMHCNGDWFRHLQEIGIACLENSPSVDALLEVLAQLNAPVTPLWNIQPHRGPLAGQCLMLSPKPTATDEETDSSPQNASSARPLDLNLMQSLNWNEALLRQQRSSYSLWYAAAGEDGNDVLLSCKGLPQTAGFTAMLTGQWQEYGWNLVI